MREKTQAKQTHKTYKSSSRSRAQRIRVCMYVYRFVSVCASQHNAKEAARLSSTTRQRCLANKSKQAKFAQSKHNNNKTNQARMANRTIAHQLTCMQNLMFVFIY